MTDIDLAYLAGLVDGEGTISIKTEGKTRPHTVYLHVSNTNENVIALCEEAFGGRRRLRKWKNKKWKPCWEWILTKEKACEAIRKLRPFLRIKQKQADLALGVMALRRSQSRAYWRWNPDAKVARDVTIQAIKDQIQVLNKRGL